MTLKSVASHYYVTILRKNMSFSNPLSSKKVNYIVFKKFLDLLYSLYSSHTYPNVFMIY
jgi:hypothetical protein